ncbi:MAG: OmpA family protein [Gammaproteobacteria bacterium]
MITTKNKIALTLALACLAGTALAQSTPYNPSLYIQPSAIWFDPDSEFGVDDRDWGGGLKFGKPVHPNWDLQFGATHARAEENAYHYRQTLLGLDALLMLSRSNFRPFILFGAGAERDKVENPLRHVRKTSPYLTAGVGFQLGFTERWALQADYRVVRGRLRDEERFGFKHPSNRYLAVGLNYAFNAPPAPPPPRPVEPPPAAVAPPPPPPPPAPPPPPPRFEKFTLSATELFAFNSATLAMPQPRLDDIAAALTADPTITDVDITGYTDRLGSDKYNMRLSEKRANAVRDYLVSKGIAGNRLKAYGKGKANPVVTCNDKKRSDLIRCLEPNRRVEVEQITVEKRVQ